MKRRISLAGATRAGCSVLYALTLLISPAMCFAQDTPSIYTDVDKLIRSGEEVKALGSDLFGEKINMYNGAVEFIQTDVSLPGNNALPVSAGRKLTPVPQIGPSLGVFGDWDLEIPHLHGIFARQGSMGTSPAPAGCSDFAAPAGRYYQGGNFNADEFWYGSFVSIPGLGDEEMLASYSGNSTSPTDGNSWPLTTRSLWAISCLSGDGFVVVTTNGNRYRFDWPVTREYPSLVKATPLAEQITSAGGLRGGPQPTGQRSAPPAPQVADGYLLPRLEKWILPTQVTDRFGNTVNYSYDPAHPWRLLSIVASDGRHLDFSYPTNSDTVASISDGQRTWTYSYAVTSNTLSLSQITQPDNSVWHFSMAPLTSGSQPYGGASTECDTTGLSGSDVDVGSMTHPSGATGSFSVRTVSHPRSFVPRACLGGDPGDPTSQWAYYPKYISNKALVSKTISGPGLPAESWAYAYSTSDSASWSDCSGTCPDSLTTETTDPRGVLTRYTFGTRFRVSEGQLQKVEVMSSGNTYRTTTMTYRAPDAGPYAVSIGQSFQKRGNGDLASRFTPQDRKVVTQQAVDFVWQADGNSFDSMARPHTVTRSSSLGSRQETTAYDDNTAMWVLGQVKSVTEVSTGKVMVANVYDPNTANLLSKSSFGRLQNQYTYNPDGTLATKSDGLNQATTFSSYKRGIAQNVLYADTTTESAVVDNQGNITSVTDANNYSMTFGYDAIGRLSQINYPTGDPVVWNSTQIAFESVPVSEVDLDAGHWRQTISTGNGQTVTYFDALFRPRLTKTLDTGDLASTKTILRRFDSDNRKIYESYPAQTIASVNASVPGIGTVFDALGRVAQTNADSELGVLTTTTAYLTNFQKQVTNPRNLANSMTFQAFDEPSEKALTGLWSPGDQTTIFNRDVFGKPTSVTRSGTYPGTNSDDPAESVSVTRNYVYDPVGEVLCKTVEPETGATISLLDAAGNVSWRAAGLTSTGLTGCDYDSTPPAKKITYVYDTLNRLTTTSYGDGSPGITRTYHPDGLVHVLASGNSTRSYDYNQRRLLTHEDFDRTSGSGPSTNTPEYSAQLGVASSKLAFSSATGLYNGRVVITNRSDAAITGPLVIAFASLSPGVTLQGASIFQGMPSLSSQAGIAAGATLVVPVSFANPNRVVVSYTIRVFGNVPAALASDGSLTNSLDSSYDANGHLQSTTYPDTAVVAYAPNALGEPTQVGIYATGISYFPNGSVANYSLGNGVVHSSSQNLRGLPRTVSDSGVYQDQYDYDENANVTAVTDLQQDVTTKTMTYDGLDRLTGSSSPNQWGDATYAYDPLDNLRRSVIAPRDSIHHYSNNLLQYIATSGQPSLDYGYDAQGNIVSRGGQAYVFDIGNRMQLASGLETYEYDGNGLRFGLTATNGRSKFQMYAQSGKLMYGTEQAPGYSPATVRYMYLGGKLIAETYGDGTISYVHTDGLGSPVARSSGTSATPGPYTRYEPYGNSTAAGPAPSPIGFTGHVNDLDTGLTYMQQRYYDPIAGRFMSVDPVVTNASSGSSFGRYHYVNNNPYRYTDPDGRQVCNYGAEVVCSSPPTSLQVGGGSPNSGSTPNATLPTVEIKGSAGNSAVSRIGSNMVSDAATAIGNDSRFMPRVDYDAPTIVRITASLIRLANAQGDNFWTDYNTRPERQMLARVIAGSSDTYTMAWFRHEDMESSLLLPNVALPAAAFLVAQQAAHQQALQAQGVTQQQLYAPSVVNGNPTLFGPAYPR